MVRCWAAQQLPALPHHCGITKGFSNGIFRPVSPKLDFSQHPWFPTIYCTLRVKWLLGNSASPLWKTGQSNFKPPTRHKHWARQEYQWPSTVQKPVRLKLQQCTVFNSFQYLLGHNHLLIITTLVSRAPRQPGVIEILKFIWTHSPFSSCCSTVMYKRNTCTAALNYNTANGRLLEQDWRLGDTCTFMVSTQLTLVTLVIPLCFLQRHELVIFMVMNELSKLLVCHENLYKHVMFVLHIQSCNNSATIIKIYIVQYFDLWPKILKTIDIPVSTLLLHILSSLCLHKFWTLTYTSHPLDIQERQP